MTTGAARPTGITILAVLAAIGGVSALLAGFGLVFGGGVLMGTGSIGGPVVLLGIAFLALGALGIALAYGFWTLMPWAWPLGVILELANLGLIIATAAVSGNIVGSLISQIIGIAVAVGILYYLNQPTIKTLFGRT